ncbi:MAG: tyrosine-type recombinase/integrase [Chitinophagales bacterium]
MAVKKKANGEGSIWQRPNGTWVAQVSYIDPIDGKRKRKSVSGKTKQEVLKKKRGLEVTKDAGRLVDNGKLTLGQWLDRWLEVYKKPALKYSTWFSYKQLADIHIKPVLGDRQLDRLQANEIQAFYNALSDSGRIIIKNNGQQVNGKSAGLSPQTIRNCHNVLRGAFNQAYKEALIQWNPISAIELPARESREIQPFTAAEVTYFLNAIKDHELYALIITDLGTGLRRGELLGLQWSNVNMEERTAAIRRSLIQIGSEIRWQDSVKTKASKSTVTLPGEVIKVLKQVIKQQARNKLLLGEAYQDNDLVFCRADGTAYRPDYIYHQYKRLLAANSLPDTTFHALRHTFCTLLLESGEDLATVSKLARHSSVSITADLYVHKTQTMQERAANRMDAILTGTKQNSTQIVNAQN